MSIRQSIAALLIGLLGSVLIWVVAPYNNFILANAFISDDFIPVAAVGLILLLVLGINPLLHFVVPRLRLTFPQLALIFGILLVASITPSQGGLRHFLYPVGATPLYVSQDQGLSRAYKTLDPPAALFPERLGYGNSVPASESFVDELPAGESIPWGKWVAPTIAWAGFFVPYWLMLTAMAVIVLPYWRDTERQPFPLLEAQRALIEDTQSGALPPAMTRPLFWLGFGTVFFLHLLRGLSQYYPTGVPAIPLDFKMWQFFTEPPFRNLPQYVKTFQIHFLFLGIAYFMPNRVGLSIWFFQIVYAVFIMYGVSYTPMFHAGVVTDHRLGAWVAIPLCIVWFGRAHWWGVLKSVFTPAVDDEQLRRKVAGTALLAGAMGVWCWLLWVGVPWWWAMGLIVAMFLFALGMTRIVAETGVPLMAPSSQYVGTLVNLLPLTWRTAAGVYFSGIVGIVVGHLNRVCAMTMVCHAIGLDRHAKPRTHLRLAGLFFGLILLGCVVGGFVQLTYTYHYSETLNHEMSAMGRWGDGYFRWMAEGPLRQFLDGQSGTQPYNQVGHIAFGAALAVFLLVMCQRSARWPIHPVPLLFVGNWYAHRIWFSVLLGWALKMTILQLGGARGYKVGRDLFLGIMIGEVASVMLWAVVAALVAAAGGEYQVVAILPF
ncbi:MAG: hypothetical protein GC164_06115 [Phycisphaera sp.]|nr:hypothetical protein [Phycisphaera sp.]